MIQVIIRALDILEFVAQHGKEPVQLFRIAEHAGLSQPTTANIVKTLVQKNYLEQLGRKKGYRLGIGSYQLTGNPSYQQDLITAAKECMEELTGQLKETSILAMIRNNKRVVIHLVESDQMLQVRTAMVAEVYNTSTGRLLMAYLSAKELDNLIKTIGIPTKKLWPGADTKAGLDKALKNIRQEEFVQTLSVHHTVGFAVPVYKNKQVIAGLSVFVPESRYTESHKEKISRSIRRASKKITERLEKTE
ncbi:MAG: IclR family transcriptional regulator [Chitinophagaceae bacterium]|nr:IclR family transcriptional regulator [Chitinophagaceae bacterium]